MVLSHLVSLHPAAVQVQGISQAVIFQHITVCYAVCLFFLISQKAGGSLVPAGILVIALSTRAQVLVPSLNVIR